MQNLVRVFNTKPMKVDVPPYKEQNKVLVLLESVGEKNKVKLNVINRKDINYLTNNEIKHYVSNYMEDLLKLCTIEDDISFMWNFIEE